MYIFNIFPPSFTFFIPTTWKRSTMDYGVHSFNIHSRHGQPAAQCFGPVPTISHDFIRNKETRCSETIPFWANSCVFGNCYENDLTRKGHKATRLVGEALAKAACPDDTAPGLERQATQSHIVNLCIEVGWFWQFRRLGRVISSLYSEKYWALFMHTKIQMKTMLWDRAGELQPSSDFLSTFHWKTESRQMSIHKNMLLDCKLLGCWFQTVRKRQNRQSTSQKILHSCEAIKTSSTSRQVAFSSPDFFPIFSTTQAHTQTIFTWVHGLKFCFAFSARRLAWRTDRREQNLTTGVEN